MKKSCLTNDGQKQKIPGIQRDFSDQIINNSRSMLSIINHEYVYEKVNSTFCKAHKSLPDLVIGKNIGDIWGNEVFLNTLKENIDQCFSGKTIRYEASFRTPLLGMRYFEVIFRPLATDSGKITHVMAETFDINQLKQSELKAIRKDEELKAFETNIPVGFVRCEHSGQIIHANNAFLKIMDCSEEDILNLDLQRFYPEGLLKIHIGDLTDCNSKSFGIIPVRNFKGKEIQCRVSAYTCRKEECRFVDFAFENCTRELMLENRLLQAQKLETIGALAGGIAHDFNNILTTITGYSQLLQEDLPAGSDSSEKIVRINSAISRAKSIINQILTFSRQVDQEKIPVRVAEVLKETIGFVNSAIPHNIVLKSRITGQKAYVLADPTQLFRVFLNLMTNAIQAMENKGGTLSVNMKVVDGDFLRNELSKYIVADEYVMITVKDSGTGMDPSHMERIFEPFFTTREVGSGTGLGLSVTHGIITEMEGEILVSSRKDKGSSFYVYLPVSKINHDPDPGEKKRILFITGNKYESRILSLALRNKGYELVYSSDRTRLNRILTETDQVPDLIIYMSDSKKIHENDLIGIFSDNKINIPCILIATHEQELSGEKLVTSGIIKQRLIKPVSLREITDAIQASLLNKMTLKQPKS